MVKIIRRPDFAGGGITPAEKIQLDAVAQDWAANALSTAPADLAEVDAAIRGLYAAAGLKSPRVVLVPSPLAMAMAGGFAAGVWYLRKNHRATDAATRAATDAATDAATYAATDALSWRAVAAGFGDPDFLLGCAQKWSRMYQGGNMWSAWDSYICGSRDVLGLRLPDHEKYAAWESCAKSSGFRIMHEEFCIVSDRPEILRMDDQNRPHCEDGPSHRWRDGWSLYHWHGVRVPDEWITNRDTLTASMALGQENTELRRCACEILGWAKVLKELDAVTIDRDEDPMIGELLEVDLPDSEKERFLRVKCGTGREFAIPVPPDQMTALSANAWTFGIEPDILKQLEVRT